MRFYLIGGNSSGVSRPRLTHKSLFFRQPRTADGRIIFRQPRTADGTITQETLYKIVIILFLAIFISLLICSTVKTEPMAEYPIIDTLIVIGNRVTKPFVIFSEMELSTGSLATPEAIERDRNRLESIGLFSRVQLVLVEVWGKHQLQIIVTELWYIWPGIHLEVDEDELTNIKRTAYGVRLNLDNFRGRREKFVIVGLMGYRRGGQLEWRVPYLFFDPPLNPPVNGGIDGSPSIHGGINGSPPVHGGIKGGRARNWSLSLEMRRLDEDEPKSLPTNKGVTTQSFSFTCNLGKRFDLERTLNLELTLERRSFFKNDDESYRKTVPATDDDFLLGFIIGWIHDTRHYRPWPAQGHFFEYKLESSASLTSTDVSYIRPEATMAFYRLLFPGFYTAARAQGMVTFGPSPSFRRRIINKYKLVRTAAKRTWEGDRHLLLQGELRADLLRRTYITLPAPKLIQPYTRNLKFGISCALFADHGVVEGIDKPYSLTEPNRFYAGWESAYGIALIFHVPYQDVIRLEVSRSARFPDDGLLFQLRLGPAF